MIAEGIYEGTRGAGRTDFADAVPSLNRQGWPVKDEPAGAFDCNGNGRIDFADVVWLLSTLRVRYHHQS